MSSLSCRTVRNKNDEGFGALALVGGNGGSIERVRIQCEVSTAGSYESVVSSTLRREKRLERDRPGSAFKLSLWENPLGLLRFWLFCFVEGVVVWVQDIVQQGDQSCCS